MLYKEGKLFEVVSNLPKIPIVGEFINCDPHDDANCEDWIISSIKHHISRNGQYVYVEVECYPVQ